MAHKQKTKKKKKIVIYISGGVLHSVHSNVPGLVVRLIDADDLAAEDKTEEEVHRLWRRTTQNMYCAY